MKILMVGDIVGGGGRTAFARVVAILKQKGQADVVVANAENTAGGKGITRAIAQELLAAGADVLTMGDHCWDQKELVATIDHESRLVRPANFAPGCPGRGWVSIDSVAGRITVINLIGRVFMPPYDCPFRTVQTILEKEPNLGKLILVDIHAEATSEKIAMGWFLDGKVTAVVGTHTHVQTSDERILPKGTGYITDLGMTGPRDSVIGRGKESVIARFLKGMPGKFEVAENDIVVEGVILDVDEGTGRVRKIVRIRETGM